jgi:hypothetical protein
MIYSDVAKVNGQIGKHISKLNVLTKRLERQR